MQRLFFPLFRLFERITAPFPEADYQDNQSPPTTLKGFFVYHLRGYKKPLIILAILNAIVAILEVSLFGFMGSLIDWLNVHERSSFLADEFWALLGMAVVVLLLLPLFGGLANLINFQTLMGNFPMAIRWRAHRHLLGQSLGFYQDEFAGRVATKVMQTALATRETVVKLIEVLVYMLVYFLSMLIILLQINLWLMLPMLIWLGLYLLIQRYYVPKLRKISEVQADARSTMTGRIVDAYTNISTVKLFAHTEREGDYAKRSMNDFLQTVYQQMRLVNLLIFLIEYLNYILIFSVATTGIILWLNEAVTTGAIAIAIAMAIRLIGMSHWLMFEVATIFESLGTVTDGKNMLSLPHAVNDSATAQSLIVSEGKIDFNHVDFSYHKPHANNDEAAKTISVIEQLNLHIQPGERIGLVGRSGAGKSTLVNALLRFYDIDKGEILIDGQNIATVTQDSLREQIAMVTQDTSLLHRSVRENILYGRPDASEAELQAAIKQAKADEFIEQLTDPQGNQGLDAQVGERGVKLSGGQRQRIAIARVLLKNAPILILDEATSALDSEVESAIQESLIGLMAGKTVIAIAHRLSTIAALDRLVVLEDGRIIEQGTHQQLLDKNGIYANLWAHQTGGFLGDA